MVFVFQVQSSGQTQAKTEAPWLWQAIKNTGSAAGEGAWNYVIKPMGNIAYNYGPGTGTFELGRQTYVAFEDGKYVEGGAMTAFALLSAAADYSLVRRGYGLFKGTKGWTATKSWLKITNEGLTKEEFKEFRKTGTLSIEEPVEETSKKTKAKDIKVTQKKPTKSVITKGIKATTKELSALKDDTKEAIKSAAKKTKQKAIDAASTLDTKMKSWIDVKSRLGKTSDQYVFKRTKHINEVKNLLQEDKGFVGKRILGTTYNPLELGTGTVEGGIALGKTAIGLSYLGVKYAVTRPFVNLPAGIVSLSTKIIGPSFAEGMQYEAGNFGKDSSQQQAQNKNRPILSSTPVKLPESTAAQKDTSKVAKDTLAAAQAAPKFTDADYAAALGMEESEIGSLGEAEKSLLAKIMSDTTAAREKVLSGIRNSGNVVGMLRSLLPYKDVMTVEQLATTF